MIWTDQENHFNGLIPEKDLLNVDMEKFWSTIEPQHLVEEAYPALVETYKQSKIKPKKASKRKKTQNAVDEIDQMLQNASITEPKPKKNRNVQKTRKGKATATETCKAAYPDILESKSKLKTLDSFLKQAVVNNFERNTKPTAPREKIMSSTPAKKVDDSFSSMLNLSISNFEDDQETDLSDIVEDIVKHKPHYLVNGFYNNCNFALNQKQTIEEAPANSSSFFIDNPMENDLFEQTFNDLCAKDDDGDSDENTIEYGDNEYILDNQEDVVDDEKNVVEESDDSFEICNIPLLERIKGKRAAAMK